VRLFIGGYPFWLGATGGARFGDPDQKAAYAFYLESAVKLNGPEVTQVTEASADLGLFTYIGVAERSGGSAYATLLAIDPPRGVVSAHRKLRPTYEERLVWAAGDGHGLRVHNAGGLVVGGLNCWENWMPQARHALYADGEQLHVGVWPGGCVLTSDITRFIALEGRVWSLAAGTVFGKDDISSDFPLYDRLAELDAWPEYDGGSAIAAPDGSWVREPVSGVEMLVVADVDTATVSAERQNFDPAGHYARPDVFRVTVDRRRHRAAVFED